MLSTRFDSSRIINCLTNIVVSCCFPGVFGSHLRIRVAVWAGLLLGGMPDRKEAAASVCGTAFRLQERLFETKQS
jgi:hypothetical protein